MSSDRERRERDVARLERYVQWRERIDRAEREARAARRRWWLRRAAVMLGLTIAIVGLLTWLVQNRQTTRQAAVAPPTAEPQQTRQPAAAHSDGAQAPDVDSAATPAAESSRPSRQQPAALADRTTRAPDRLARRATTTDGGVAAPRQSSVQPRDVARHQPAELVAAAPTSDSDAGSSGSVAAREPAATAVAVVPRETAPPTSPTDVAAAVPTPEASTTSDATSPDRGRILAVAPSTPPESIAAGPDVAAPSAPSEERSAGPAKPPCSDLAAALQRSIDGRSRTQRVTDCVGGWFKSESQEAREGVKREIEEFRSGVDKIGRGLQWLGGKLRQ